MRDRRDPPRALVAALAALLTAVVVYPLHRPYLHPDQDVVPTLPLVQMARGSWSPLILQYGSAFPNLLHVLDAILLRLGRLAGWWETPTDLLVAWCASPWHFRLPARAIAMAAGLGSLAAVHALVARIADRWSALVAPALLGSFIVFVREHHYGWYDAPASGAAMLALWAAAAGRFGLAGALAGLATSFKYNLVMAVPAVLAAALVVRGRRLATATRAALAAFAAFALTTPEVVLEPIRLYEWVAAYIPLQSQVLASGAGAAGNHLPATLARGIGWIALVLAAAGFVRAVVARERGLVAVLAFVVVYGIVLVRTPLALGRYALPIAGPVAVLAAYALAPLPLAGRLAIAAAVVGLGAPGVAGYLRLLGVEDTRVEAARLVEREWAAGGRAVIAANPVLWMYVAPDVPQLPRYPLGLPPDVARTLGERAPRCMRPMEPLGATLAGHEGALVVTSEAPAPHFERASTPAATLALLEREATLVADLAVERAPASRDFEAFDLNYVPWSDLGSLARPGPRMRLWRVPPGRE